MGSVRFDAVGYAHDGGALLFEGATFVLGSGFTGLVGENGAGKTTLLELVARERTASEGAIERLPKNARIALCPQRVDVLGDDLGKLASDEGRAARRIRSELGLDPEDLDRWSSLSPGERKRWQIGAALASEPDILLLDEPSNHLDIDARGFLVAALDRYRGVGLVVSHDRALLDAITRSTLRLHARGAALYAGPYSAARTTWLSEEASKAREHDAHRASIQKAARLLADSRRQLDSAAASLSTSSRSKGAHDRDAREGLRKGKARMAEKRIGRQVGVIRARLERLVDCVPAAPMEKQMGRSIFVGYEAPRRSTVFGIDEPTIRAGSHEVLFDVRLVVPTAARISIEGSNGAGKTTLLHALLEKAAIPASKVLFVPQHLDAERGRSLIAELCALPPEPKGRVLSLVAALGVPPEKLLVTRQASPGETRKLMLAFGLGLHPWALVLDEPTNDLDLPAIERLEEALAAYPGALLLVTHDRALAARVTTTTWRIADKAVRVA